MTKQELRKEIRQKRAALSEEEILRLSSEVCSRLITERAYINSSVVLAYAAIKGEVDVNLVISAALFAGKIVALPRVSGKTMSFYEIKSFDDLQTGYMGIPEPKDYCQIVECDEAFMIMPGTAFDMNLHRCGYGGGFYDRYLEYRPKIKKAAVAFDFQIYDEIPYETNDIKPDIVVTESRILR